MNNTKIHQINKSNSYQMNLETEQSLPQVLNHETDNKKIEARAFGGDSTD